MARITNSGRVLGATTGPVDMNAVEAQLHRRAPIELADQPVHTTEAKMHGNNLRTFSLAPDGTAVPGTKIEIQPGMDIGIKRHLTEKGEDYGLLEVTIPGKNGEAASTVLISNGDLALPNAVKDEVSARGNTLADLRGVPPAPAAEPYVIKPVSAKQEAPAAKETQPKATAPAQAQATPKADSKLAGVTPPAPPKRPEASAPAKTGSAPAQPAQTQPAQAEPAKPADTAKASEGKAKVDEDFADQLLTEDGQAQGLAKQAADKLGIQHSQQAMNALLSVDGSFKTNFFNKLDTSSFTKEGQQLVEFLQVFFDSGNFMTAFNKLMGDSLKKFQVASTNNDGAAVKAAGADKNNPAQSATGPEQDTSKPVADSNSYKTALQSTGPELMGNIA